MEHPIVIDSEGRIGPRQRSIYQLLSQKLRDQIMAEEDAEIFKALDAASKYADEIEDLPGNNKE